MRAATSASRSGRSPLEAAGHLHPLRRRGLAGAAILFGLANVAMGFGVGPFNPSFISVIAGMFLIVVSVSHLVRQR